MTHKKIISKIILTISLFALYNLHAEGKIITQELEPHPFLEIFEWNAHEGELTIEEVIADNRSIWKTEKLNVPFWEKNEVKWFKQDIVIPKDIDGFDAILYIHVSPSAVVYVDGKELFVANGYSGKGLLAHSAKAGEKYSIQVKTINGEYNSRFYNARLVGMPVGYGKFLSSFSIVPPKDGVAITDWKFKMKADDDAAQIGFDDSDWEEKKSGNGWRGEMQHAWYRKEITLPKEIDGFQVEG